MARWTLSGQGKVVCLAGSSTMLQEEGLKEERKRKSDDWKRQIRYLVMGSNSSVYLYIYKKIHFTELKYNSLFWRWESRHSRWNYSKFLFRFEPTRIIFLSRFSSTLLENRNLFHLSVHGYSKYHSIISTSNCFLLPLFSKIIRIHFLVRPASLDPGSIPSLVTQIRYNTYSSRAASKIHSRGDCVERDKAVLRYPIICNSAVSRRKSIHRFAGQRGYRFLS